jgi:plasmid maintenance system antidote protein VapI
LRLSRSFGTISDLWLNLQKNAEGRLANLIADNIAPAMMPEILKTGSYRLKRKKEQ